MTDRLTPAQILREVAHAWQDWKDDGIALSFAEHLIMRAARMDGDARREAAADTGTEYKKFDRVAVDPNVCLRDGTEQNVTFSCAKCGWKGCDKSCLADVLADPLGRLLKTAKEQSVAAADTGTEAQPAPAADDLPRRLRKLPWDMNEARVGRTCDEAADRIEALQARVARLTEALKLILDCPAIADGNLRDLEWGCAESAEAERQARAALAEASDAGKEKPDAT